MKTLATAVSAFDHAGLIARLDRVRAWRGTLILNYHRIADGPAADGSDLWSATVEELDDQLRYLSANLEVVGPAGLGRTRRAARQVMLTFDDGYRDSYELAYPLLRRHGVPATFFIATGFIDRPRPAWWDEIAWMVKRSDPSYIAGLHASKDLAALEKETARQEAIERLVTRYKELPTAQTEPFLNSIAEQTGSGRCEENSADTWMTWEMIRELEGAGMSIGGHTVNHPILARMPPEQQREEVRGCALRLHEELGIQMEWFAYPVGLPETFDEHTKTCLRDAGVKLAFSFYGGYPRRRVHDPYDIKRAGMWLGMNPDRFRARTVLPLVYARY